MRPMQPSSSGASPGAPPEPGERRRLDHPPSDRYATSDSADSATEPADVADETATETPPRERLLRGIAVGLAGAIAFVILGGPLSITAGLVGLAGVIGWVVGAVTRAGRLPAVAIALASVALGLAGIWLYAGTEGGVLGPLDYLAEVQGVLVPIELAVAGILAAAAS
jgi:hypothetical protein